MGRRPVAIRRYLVDLRSILLGFAIFNFTIAWARDAQIHFTCTGCPWFHPWSHFNEPTILLVAALFLRTNRWWSNTIALLLKAISLLTSFTCSSRSMIPSWLGDTVGKSFGWTYPYFVGSWDSQYLFALIVFSYSALSLKRITISKD